MKFMPVWVVFQPLDDHMSSVAFGDDFADAWHAAWNDYYADDAKPAVGFSAWVSARHADGWLCVEVTESTSNTELAKLRAERVKLLAVLKAAREHHAYCWGDLEPYPDIPARDRPLEEHEEWSKKDDARRAGCSLGPPLSDCEGIETP